ncbi:MAG: cytidylate kinase family protein [Methanosarcinales archaeon]|jgi:cytidylate kinase|nr:cytidylate kinase family protein [Methanosarcinales archaeon]
MIITLSGLPGSGTSTLAKSLSNLLGYNVISAGDIFRRNAVKNGMTLEEFGRRADSDYSIDTRLDNELVELVSERDNIIFEGRLTGHFILSQQILKPSGFLRVRLDAPFDTRVSRIASRDKKPLQISYKESKLREENELRRHEKNYGVNVNMAAYDVIFNSEKLSAIQMADAIYSIVLYSPFGRKGCIVV